MRNRIYPLFMPHAGCPFRCVYCNQHAVTKVSAGKPEGGLAGDIMGRMAQLAHNALQSGIPGELAFYGGTFTQLPDVLLETVLDSAANLVRQGAFTGIRFSTRPDAMSQRICSFLKNYPVQTVELGVQSFSDEVLRQTRRGYTADAVADAAGRVRESGWALGIQLMPGLPGDSKGRFLQSVAAAAAFKPRFMRFYPTLVLEGTELAQSLRDGSYRPISLKEAIDWCVSGWEILYGAGIPLARAGLHADPELERGGRIVAGPWHPAFGYLLRVQWWRRRVDERIAALACGADYGTGPDESSLADSSQAAGEIARMDEMARVDPIKPNPPTGGGVSLSYAIGGGRAGRRLEIRVPARQVSEAIGPKRINIRYWRKRWAIPEVRVIGDPELSLDDFCCR